MSIDTSSLDVIVDALNNYDYIILGFIFFCGIVGLANGFIKELINLTASVITLVAAKFLSGPISEWLYSKFSAYDMLNVKVTEIVQHAMKSHTGNTAQLVSEGINKIPLVGPIINKVSGNLINMSAADYGEIIEKEFVHTVVTQSLPIIRALMAMLAFVIAYIIITIIVKVVLVSMERLTSIKGLPDATNKLFGFIFGLTKGVLISVVVFSLIFVYFSFADPARIGDLTSSMFFQVLSHLNIVKFLNFNMLSSLIH